MLLCLLKHIWMGKTSSVFMAEEPLEVLVIMTEFQQDLLAIFS